MREHRLVTLAGVGGSGKTETALQVGRALNDSAGTAVCFVALAPLSDPSLVVTAIASALGVQEVPNRPLLETLVTYLKSKTLLLILDNCEHVITHAAEVAETILSSCARVRILATSRESLRAAGEHSFRLPSLSAHEAVALFSDRARAVDNRFALTDENIPDRRRALPSLRRHSAGNRTCRRTREPAVASSARGETRRSISDSRPRRTHGSSAAANDGRDDRLELRVALRARAEGI